MAPRTITVQCREYYLSSRVQNKLGTQAKCSGCNKLLPMIRERAASQPPPHKQQPMQSQARDGPWRRKSQPPSRRAQGPNHSSPFRSSSRKRAGTDRSHNVQDQQASPLTSTQSETSSSSSSPDEDTGSPESLDKSAEITRLMTLLTALCLPQDQSYADMINLQISELKKQLMKFDVI